MRRSGRERCKRDGEDEAEQPPEHHRDPRRDDARNHPDGHGEEGEAERLRHDIHPVAGRRHQPAANRAEDDERHPLSEPEREERGRPESHVAGLRDVEERAGQRSRHARADDEGGEKAEPGARRKARARGSRHRPVDGARPDGGEPQCERAEHRQREKNEEDGRQRDGERRLQRHLQVLPRPGRGDADQTEGACHREHIGERMGRALHDAPLAADPAELTGEDRIHREDARGESEAQAEREEGCDRKQRTAVREKP